jgi:hypothetical protein
MNPTDRKLLLEGKKMIGGVYRPRFAIHGEVKLSPSLFIQYRCANPMTGGKRLLVRENTKTFSIRAAQRLLAARKDDLKRGKATGPVGDKITYDDLANALTRDYEAKGRKSLRRVKIGLAHLKGRFGGWRASAITSEQVNEYIIARKKEDAAPASINRELAMLRRMFNLQDRLPSKPKIELLPEHQSARGIFRARRSRGAGRTASRLSQAGNPNGIYHRLAREIGTAHARKKARRSERRLAQAR